MLHSSSYYELNIKSILEIALQKLNTIVLYGIQMKVSCCFMFNV
jgi:hypothetical protein